MNAEEQVAQTSPRASLDNRFPARTAEAEEFAGDACGVEEFDIAPTFGPIVGRSPLLVKVLRQIELVAPTRATVLVCGESGTGKELVAREIHKRSQRANRRLITVNCSAVPRDLCESEFFGHVRGAFTGALHDRPGRFLVADGGTIFLDEVGDLPIDLQPKLLGVLQEGYFDRVGDDVPRRVDVRVIAATNRNLAAEVQAGRFRPDLYYRLSVFPIELPPLRLRREDIPLLAAHFVPFASRRLSIPAPRIPRQQCEQLQGYDWPGNVRELQNVIERSVILSQSSLRLDLVLPDREARPAVPSLSAVAAVPPSPAPVVPEPEWRRQKAANIHAALVRAGGRIYGHGGAAELLGIKPSTLSSRLRSLRISAGQRRCGAR